MNDSSEVEYGVNCLDEAWASVRGEAPGVGVTDFLAEVMDHDFSTSVSEMGFAFCASRSRDMLSQWIQYAGPRGFAIGLDSSQKLARKRGDGLAVGTPLVPPLVESWLEVDYKRSSSITLLTDSLKRIAAAYKARVLDQDAALSKTARGVWVEQARSLMRPLVLRSKDKAFSAEREVRYVCPVRQGGVIGHRVVRGHLTPYVAVSNEFRSTLEDLRPQLPIVEVMCGPSTSATDEAVVVRLLAMHRLGGAKVTRSAIPYVG